MNGVMDIILVLGYLLVGAICLLIPSTYLITALFSLIKRSDSPLFSEDLPFVTILIPTFNEGENVKRIITGLKTIDYPEDKLEIIFIDDSSDSTSEVINAFKSHKGNVQVLRRHGRFGKPSALNDGLARSKGEIIIVYDADSLPQPSSLKTLVNALKEEETVAAQGGYEVEHRNTLNKLIDLEYALWQGGQLVAVPVLIGYNYAVKRSYLEKIGGWDPDALAEDHVLWYKIYSDGKKIKYVENAKVKVLEPVSLKEFIKQRKRWSRGSAQATEKIRKEGGRLLPEPYALNLLAFSARYIAPSQTAFFMILLLFLLPLALFNPNLHVLTIIVSVSILLSLFASLLFCVRMGKLKLWPLFIPLSFLILYQNILFLKVRRSDITWEKIQK